MDVKKTLDRFFQNYGSKFTSEEGFTVLGILSKKSPYSKNEIDELGQTISGERYFYFSAEDKAVKKGAVLKNGEESYLVSFCGGFSLSGRELYKIAHLKDITEGRGIYEQHQRLA